MALVGKNSEKNNQNLMQLIRRAHGLVENPDLEKIQEAGLHIITPVLVCNTDEYNKISILKEGEVSPGEDVLQIS